MIGGTNNEFLFVVQFEKKIVDKCQNLHINRNFGRIIDGF